MKQKYQRYSRIDCQITGINPDKAGNKLADPDPLFLLAPDDTLSGYRQHYAAEKIRGNYPR